MTIPNLQDLKEQAMKAIASQDYLLNEGGMPRLAAAIGLPESASDEQYLEIVKEKAAGALFPLQEFPALGLCDRGPEGDTLLHVACIWGDIRAVRLLLGAGAEINAAGDMKMTPLHIAVGGRFLDVVHFLLSAGAIQTKNAFGYTPLEWARQMEYEEIVSALHGDINSLYTDALKAVRS